MSRMIAVLLLVLFARSEPLIGQGTTPAALAPGARVRITQAGQQPRVATVVAHTRDTLLVRWPDLTNTVAVPVAEISRLDVSTGRHRNLVKGMVLGTVGGAAVGALVGALAYQPCTGNCLDLFDREGSALLGGALLGTLGFVVGTLAGLPSHDTWQRVSLDGGRVAVAVRSRAQGAGLGVALRF